MRPQVFVVDDDAENCKALSELLAVEGFQTIPFQSGEAAWRAIESQEFRPDVVVADIRMPNLNGVALLRRIQERFPHIPVVLVSAFADETVWSEGLKAGALDVFPKPINGISLVGALRSVTGGRCGQGVPVGETEDPGHPGIMQRRAET